jgi:hypothetical protein
MATAAFNSRNIKVCNVLGATNIASTYLPLIFYNLAKTIENANRNPRLKTLARDSGIHMRYGTHEVFSRHIY